MKKKSPPELDANDPILLAIARSRSAGDFERPLRDLTRVVAEAMNVPMVTVSLPRNGRVLNCWGHGIPDAERPPENTLCELVLRAGRPVEVRDVAADAAMKARLAAQGAPNVRYYLGMPLRNHQGEVMGVLCVVDSVPRALSDVEIDRMETFARIAESLVRNIAVETGIEEALRVSRSNAAMLLTVLEKLPVAVLSKNARDDFKFVVWNERAEQIFGLKAEDVLGKTDFDLFPKDEAEFFRWNDLEAMNGRKIVEIPEETLTTRDGERILRTRKIPIYDEDGHPELLMVLCEDITGAKIQAAQVQEARIAQTTADRFAALAEAIPQMVWTADARGIVEYANARWRPYLRDGENGPEINYDLLHPLDREGFLEDLVRSAYEENVFTREFRLKSLESGEYRWQLARAAPLMDGEGRIARWFATSTDIHDQKQTEAELRRVEQRINAVLSNAPVVLFAIDPKGLLTYSEGKGRSHIVNPEETTVGKSVFERYADVPWLTEICRRAIAGETVTGEGEIGGRYLQTVMSPTFDDQGAQTGAIGLSLDITGTKSIERERAVLIAREAAALESSRLKGEFLANMSHEIRTPLNGIIGMAQLLRETKLDDLQKDYMKMLQDSSEILLGLINDILDLSKIEAGQVKIENDGYVPSKIIEEVLRHHRFGAQRKAIALTAKISEQLPPLANGDSLRLKQVLMNLIGNAIKFTLHGGVEVSAGWTEPGVLRVSVKDSGIGIPPEVRERLFHSFTQGDASITKKFGGTGLGLAISKNLVELMNGKIGVNSEVGKGSEFWFEVPCVPVAAKDEAAPAPAADLMPAPAPTPNVHLPAILLVEDNDINRRVVTSLLPKDRFVVDCAVNGEEAVQKHREKTFDLILMDCQMPVMDGFEATRRIRDFEAASGGRVPIVAITANAMDGDRDRCLTAGMDDYVAKPVQKKRLLEVMEHWLKTPAPLARAK